MIVVQGMPRHRLSLLSWHRGGIGPGNARGLRRINDNKKAYLHYFIDYHKKPSRRRQGRPRTSPTRSRSWLASL